MNDPTHPIAASLAYEEDAYGWALEQTRLIRAGLLKQLDWENIAEELEGMARSEYRALESALRILLVHLLKWDAQPAFRSKSWLYSIDEHGNRYQRLLQDNPSLKQYVEQIRTDAHRSARKLAAAETGLDIEVFPMEPLGWNLINNPAADESGIPPR
jgi:hypothetical protein